MNSPRRAAIVLAVGLGLMGIATPAQAATTPDPALASRQPATALFGQRIVIDPVLARAIYCFTNAGDLMLPGQVGFEYCMEHGH